MKTIQQLFGTPKPIIALLHLRALPGDPEYPADCAPEDLVECARHELRNLQDGGADGVLFSNEFSFPYLDEVPHVTSCTMGYIIGRLREEIRVPFGVHVISDPLATIDLAKAVGAQFVRSVFTGAYAGESGLRSRSAGIYIRRKRELGLNDLMMFYMINAESDGDISGRSLEVISKAIVFKCNPEGLCLSGIHAGHDADTEDLDAVTKAVPGVPVFSNTGCRKENIAEKLKSCDGAFVGTAFKKDGKFENLVELERVREFMDAVRAFRGDR